MVRSDSTRLLMLAVAIVLALLGLRLAWGLYGPGLGLGGEARAQEQTGQEQATPEAPDQGGQEAACSEGEVRVETFTGTQDQTTSEFQIEGAEWRVIVEATATTETSGDVEVTALEPEGTLPELPVGGTLAFVDPEFGPTEVASSSIIDGPGTFALEIDANGASYEVLVCESAASGGGSPSPEGTNPEPSPGSSPNPSPTPTPQPERETLMEAGGPSGGAVPMMPSGGCPREFPVLENKTCYR